MFSVKTFCLRCWVFGLCCYAVTALEAASAPADRALNTYYFSVSEPDIILTGTGRPGTTRVQLQLRDSQVSSFMPVITAAKDGLTHNVVNTWKFLQSYALQSKLVSALNHKAADKSAHRFPVAAYALQAASALLPCDASTATMRHLLTHSEDLDNQPWVPTRDAPTNVLLLPTNSAVGAVADIMSVEAVHTPGSEPAVVLTLDVVHKPDMTSELQPHPTQTLDDHAHYHFFTPAGVTVDADKFLQSVKSSTEGFSASATAIHVFAKGFECDEGSPVFNQLCTIGDDMPCTGLSQEECTVVKCVERTGTQGCCEATAAAVNSPCTGENNCVGTCDGESPRCNCAAQCTPGKTCRPAQGQCDKAEICKSDRTCPADLKAADGTTCTKMVRVPHGKKHGGYDAGYIQVESHKLDADASADTSDTASTDSSEYGGETNGYYEGGKKMEWAKSCEGTCEGGKCVLTQEDRHKCFA